jgi:hypothetical protein
MSDYTPTTDFSAKDALLTGNPLKKIQGADIDAEFDAIETAVATKYDSADLATQAQAEGGTSNAVLMTPLRTAQQLAGQSFDTVTKSKTANETVNNSATPQDDDDMAGFTIDANTDYAITGLFRMQAKAASDLRFGTNSSVAPDTIVMDFHIGAGSAVITSGDQLNGDSDVAFLTTDTDTEVLIQVWGMLKQGGTGGTFTFQWAQWSAQVENTVMQSGSFLTLSKI